MFFNILLISVHAWARAANDPIPNYAHGYLAKNENQFSLTFSKQLLGLVIKTQVCKFRVNSFWLANSYKVEPSTRAGISFGKGVLVFRIYNIVNRYVHKKIVT